MTRNAGLSFLSGNFMFACLLSVMLCGRQAHAVESPLTFGIFPYQSHQQLISIFFPLRNYLQQEIGQHLTIVTAPDFKYFRDRTRDGEYDIVFTAPHFARLAELDSGFQRVAITRYRTQSVIVVPKDSPVRKLSGLRGKTLAVPPAEAIVNMLAQELFRSKGMQSRRDFKLKEYENMQNAMFAPLLGDSDAGVSGFSPLSSFEQRDKLRVIAKSAAVPGLVIMAHPRVSKSTIAKLRKALFRFGETEQGREYFASTHHEAWLPVDDATMRSLDPYVRQARN
ncbi:MAG: phosphate/phosphite/phosphonate ABC transporter substrate-binding protein [Gallionellaceae bacterium]|jgi:phosphonate transport system substrate-binding protein